MKRNIKNGQFGWYEKGAMKRIEDNLPFRKSASVKLVYIALCSVSAKNGNSSTIKAYQTEISKFASVTDRTVRDALDILQKLKIVKCKPQERKRSGKYDKIEIILLGTNSTPSENFNFESSDREEKPSEETTEESSGGDNEENAIIVSDEAEIEATVGKSNRRKVKGSNFPVYIKEIKERNKYKINIYNSLSEITEGIVFNLEERLAFKFFLGAGEQYFAMYGRADEKKMDEIIDSWIAEFEKMLRIDGIDFAIIDVVLDWLFRFEKFSAEDLELPDSDFWRKQVRSPLKLRKRQRNTQFKFIAVLADKCREEANKIIRTSQKTQQKTAKNAMRF